MIITQTPFRMSFFGGGTDMENFFKEHGGAVLSTTFDKYCYVNREKFSQIMDKAEIVITHGGTGAIIGAVKKGKKVIAVPRLARWNSLISLLPFCRLSLWLLAQVLAFGALSI